MRRLRLSLVLLPVLMVALLAPLLGVGPLASAASAPDAVTAPQARKKPPLPTRTEVLQLNLCLSGFARCYRDVRYPMGRREAVATIKRVAPNAVTINEGCQVDLERIARRTGMRLTFFQIPFNGRPQLACKDPRGRGNYGNAVLTLGRPTVIRDRPYGDQLGPEQRRVGCVSVQTRAYCVTHLYPRATKEGQVVNDKQCAGFALALRRVARDFDVVGAGDMNRSQPCVGSPGFGFFNDVKTNRLPGIQHVYAETSLGTPSPRGIPLRYTNHDGLRVLLNR